MNLNSITIVSNAGIYGGDDVNNVFHQLGVREFFIPLFQGHA